MPSARSSPGWSIRANGWRSPSAAGWRRAARADPAAAHRRAVPPVRQLRRGRHAALHRRHRSARHSASARRRQGVSRPRRGRNDACGARGDRMARRRAVGLRDAQGIALRDRRCASARVPASVRHLPSVPRSERARRQFGSGARAHRRADGASDADCRRAAAAAAAAPRAQLPAGGRHDRPAARGHARARRLHSPAGRRAGARQRAARRRAGAAVRSGRRHLVPRLHRRAPCGRRVRSGGGADPRGEQRRRPADDGPQGQGPRVSGCHPRRSDLPHQPRRRQPLSRCASSGCAR